MLYKQKMQNQKMNVKALYRPDNKIIERYLILFVFKNWNITNKTLKPNIRLS